MTITSDMTVNEVIKLVPDALCVFSAVGIDSCCGGSLQVAEAAKRHKLDLEALMERLNGVVASSMA